MKVCILGNYHHKNRESLNFTIKYLEWELTDLSRADVVISANQFIDITKYPNKKFIFGPHFSVFPNSTVKRFDNRYNNAIYIQPSEWAANVWNKHYKYTTLPIRSYAFGVNTEQFKPVDGENKTEVILYCKRRKPSELQFVKDFLKSKDITPHIFDYVKRYNQQDYIKVLQKCKWAVWLGAHESQGFALEEALSCNVPLLVWNVRSMNQEYGLNYDDIIASTIPYWSEECGEYFYEESELVSTYEKFISKLNSYEPRKFIVETMSREKRALALQQLIEISFKE